MHVCVCVCARARTYLCACGIHTLHAYSFTDNREGGWGRQTATREGWWEAGILPPGLKPHPCFLLLGDLSAVETVLGAQVSRWEEEGSAPPPSPGFPGGMSR